MTDNLPVRRTAADQLREAELVRDAVLADLRAKVSKQVGALREMADLELMNDYAAGEMHAYQRVIDMIDGSDE